MFLFVEWFDKRRNELLRVVEIGRQNQIFSTLLTQTFTNITLDEREISASSPQQAAVDNSDSGQNIIYAAFNLFWNMSDEDSLAVLQDLVSVLKRNARAVLLINELVSPEHGLFAPHDEKIYRRRDVTLTTMHNVKPRTEKEWMQLIQRASSSFVVRLTCPCSVLLTDQYVED